MATLRHWKQRFDPDADLVFRKRMVIRGWGVDVAEPGDRVPQEMKDHFGVHRLRIWWEGGFLQIEDTAELEAPSAGAGEDLTRDPTSGVTQPPKTLQSVVHVGGGYYDVTQDGVTTRIRGKQNIPS